MSDPRIRPWWVMWLGGSRALRSAVGWTVVTLINAYMTTLLPALWLLPLLATVIAVWLAVAGWSSYFYYRRHPEAEHIPIHDRDAK